MLITFTYRLFQMKNPNLRINRSKWSKIPAIWIFNFKMIWLKISSLQVKAPWENWQVIIINCFQFFKLNHLKNLYIFNQNWFYGFLLGHSKSTSLEKYPFLIFTHFFRKKQKLYLKLIKIFIKNVIFLRKWSKWLNKWCIDGVNLN